MKFKVKFAEKIVGFSIIVAIISLAFVIMMLGSSQRWFARNILYRTELDSAAGLSKNMPVLFRGFTIGNIVSFNLTENNKVTVDFHIYEEYHDRVKTGSLVELMVNPIGLGNQFLFHSGEGIGLVPEGSLIPHLGTIEAKILINEGLASRELQHDDSVSLLLNRASSFLDNINRFVIELNEAIRSGTDETTLGRTMAGIESIPGDVNRVADSIVFGINNLTRQINNAMQSLEPIVNDLSTISAMLAAPDGSVAAILDANGEVYLNLVSSLNSLTEILEDLERTASFVPGQLPQLAGMITDLRVTLRSAQDVIIALANNPLLRGGIPERIDVQSSGTSPRDIRF